VFIGSATCGCPLLSVADTIFHTTPLLLTGNGMVVGRDVAIQFGGLAMRGLGQ
jgi:hypothetical protein